MRHIVDGFITYERCKYTGKESFSWSSYDPTPYSKDKIVVREQAIELDVPDDFDPRPQMIAALEKAKQDVRAKFAAAVKEIDDRIASLLAVENAS